MDKLTKQLLKLTSEYEKYLEKNAKTVHSVGQYSVTRKEWRNSWRIKENITFRGFINWLQKNPKPTPNQVKNNRLD